MPISLKKVSCFHEGLDHPECVAVHPDGSVWAGGEAGQIYRIAPDGRSVREVANTGGFVLGIAFCPDASWLAICDMTRKCLFRLDISSGKLTVFSDGGATKLRNPNHLAFARDGTLYVTDSGTFRKIDATIYRFDKDHSGRGDIWHAGPFNFANGCALAPDESALLVNCSWLPGVEKIDIRPDGTPGRRSVYARLPGSVPDGMAFDARGNLYVSCYYPARIYRITPERKVDIFLEDPDAHHVGAPTNIVFGGPDLRTLYAANLAQWHVSRIAVPFRGHPLPHQRP